MAKGYQLTNDNGSITTTPANYVVAHDTTTQGIVTPGTFQTITLDTNDALNGWTHTAGTDAFTCPATGLYSFFGFAQMNKTAGAISLFEFRVTIDGTPVGTVFSQTLNTNNEVKSISGGGLVFVTSGQVIRLEWTAGASSKIIAPTTVGSTKSISINIFKIS